MARDKPETKPLRQRSDHNRRFEQRETLSDAATRAIPEGEIGSGGQAVREAVKPAFRPESTRIVVVPRIIVHDPRGTQHRRARREIVATDLAGLDRSPGQDI